MRQTARPAGESCRSSCALVNLLRHTVGRSFWSAPFPARGATPPVTQPSKNDGASTVSHVLRHHAAGQATPYVITLQRVHTLVGALQIAHDNRQLGQLGGDRLVWVLSHAGASQAVPSTALTQCVALHQRDPYRSACCATASWPGSCRGWSAAMPPGPCTGSAAVPDQIRCWCLVRAESIATFHQLCAYESQCATIGQRTAPCRRAALRQTLPLAALRAPVSFA